MQPRWQAQTPDGSNEEFHCQFLAASSHRSKALMGEPMRLWLDFATRPKLAHSLRDTERVLTPNRRPEATWYAPRVRSESGG